MARRRFSEKQKTALLAKFERWEGSAAAFCRKQRLSYQTLRGWRMKKPTAVEASSFVEVELETSASRPVQGATALVAELELEAGVVLRVFRQR